MQLLTGPEKGSVKKYAKRFVCAAPEQPVGGGQLAGGGVALAGGGDALACGGGAMLSNGGGDASRNAAEDDDDDGFAAFT